MKSVVLLIALVVMLCGPAYSQSASPPPGAPSGEIQFTAHDVAALLKATQDAENSPNITISIITKDAPEMPTYDPVVHFVGVDAKSGAAVVWLMKSPPKTEASAQALRAAMELA